MAIIIKSQVFNDGEPIPTKYSCEGLNFSPPLELESITNEAVSLAIICEDPDAPRGIWSHWVIFNLPPETTKLPEMVMPREKLENGASQGSNGWGTIGYRGPCPPSGTHRYYFKIYALDVKLNLSAGVTREELLKALESHVIDEGQIMGTYTRY
ncbi:MAG: YbhB/YbcL family Raf kinase inhibitor-like protein [Methanobacterium sp.]